MLARALSYRRFRQGSREKFLGGAAQLTAQLSHLSFDMLKLVLITNECCL